MVLLNCVPLGMYKPCEEMSEYLQVSVTPALSKVGTGSEMYIYCDINAFFTYNIERAFSYTASAIFLCQAAFPV